MKFRICSIGILLLAVFANSGHTNDIQQGFMGIKWGAAVSSLENIQQLRQTEDIGYYIRADETYAINNIRLGQPIYGFFQDRLFAVFVKIDSDEHINAIMRHLDAEYGPVRAQLRVARTIFIYDYHDIKIKLKQYETTGAYKLGFYYTPLSTKLNQARFEEGAEIVIPLVPK